MNNKEKAEEIAYENNIFGRFIMDRIEATCLEMAEWKEQQIIDKASEWLKDNGRNYFSAYATEDRLIEDLKKAMEEK